MDFDFEFEDEIFQTKKRENKSNALNDNYKAKIVTPKSFLDDSTDGLDLDDAINLNKLKADHCYYTQDYEKSFHFYKSCLDLTLKSKNLNDTLFQRELEESLAMCHSFRGNHEEALKLCEKLEAKAENYNVMSSNLNLRLRLLANNKINPNYDEMITTNLRLLILHPYYIPLWIKLANLFDETCKNNSLHTKYFKICYYYVNELNKHGYFNRSEVMNKQKTGYQNWLETNKNKLKFNELFEQEVVKKLEQMDQLSDNDRISKSRETINLNELYNIWFNEFNNAIEIN